MKPFGLKPPPPRAPTRLESTADLRSLQRLMTHALVRPLTARDGLQRRWIDGRPMAEVAAGFIKPNDRLTSFERLEIYGRMYWFRLLDAVRDDCPGLRALLGERAFDRLAQGYLTKYPSRSFTLRNLCSRLERFIAEEPRFTAPRSAVAREIARFEWAQTVAFDGPSRPGVTSAQIAATPPSRLRLGLQPYVTLLVLEHPLDEWVIAVKRRSALRGEASQAAVANAGGRPRPRRPAPPRRGRIHLAVHRHENRLYYKRLEPAAFRILTSLQKGATLSSALASAGSRAQPAAIQQWFESWQALGWFCRWSRFTASPS
jgi:hypothetical protein